MYQVYRCRTRRTNRWKTHDYLRNGRSSRFQLSNQGGLLDGRVRPLPSSTVDRSPWRPLRICYLQRAFLVGRRKRRTGPGDNHWRLGDWDPGLHAIQGPGRPAHPTTNQDCRHWIRHRAMVVALSRVSKRIPRSLRFFFQAEDGIRDVAVTGVQTCALPILPNEWKKTAERGSPVGRTSLPLSLVQIAHEPKPNPERAITHFHEPGQDDAAFL